MKYPLHRQLYSRKNSWHPLIGTFSIGLALVSQLGLSKEIHIYNLYQEFFLVYNSRTHSPFSSYIQYI